MDITNNNKPLILVVEDNTANLYLAVSILKKADYEIAVAKNGIEAIEAIENITPDIILLDIMMPEMDGYEVCSQLKSNIKTKDIPVIFLTALKKHESLVKGFECGAIDYITKPFNKEELLLRVKNHLDLKFSKDEIIRQKVELGQLNDEISALLRITAHDLKNPIHGISGLLEIMQIMLQDDVLDKEAFEDIINSCTSSAEQANSIIMNILVLDKLKKGDKKVDKSDQNLNKLALNIFRNNRYKAEKKGINFEFSNFDNDIILNTDKDKLTRVIDNIISNAIKFTEPEKNIRFECTDNKNSILFAVHDEGPGISEEEQEKMFKRYQTLSNKPTGDEVSTGLGLSIVKEFTDLLGYELAFESKIGKGTSFYIIIKKQI